MFWRVPFHLSENSRASLEVNPPITDHNILGGSYSAVSIYPLRWPRGLFFGSQDGSSLKYPFLSRSRVEDSKTNEGSDYQSFLAMRKMVWKLILFL